MDHARLTLISATDYLSMEQAGDTRHEFVAGPVFAMVGARDSHNTIALNIASALRAGLRGGPCRVFISDIKLRANVADAYYYPDVFVTCDSGDAEYPVLVVEVLLPRTEAVDPVAPVRLQRRRNCRVSQRGAAAGVERNLCGHGRIGSSRRRRGQ